MRSGVHLCALYVFRVEDDVCALCLGENCVLSMRLNEQWSTGAKPPERNACMHVCGFASVHICLCV